MVRRQIKEANSGSVELFHHLDLRLWGHPLYLTKLLKKPIKEGVIWLYSLVSLWT